MEDMCSTQDEGQSERVTVAVHVAIQFSVIAFKYQHIMHDNLHIDYIQISMQVQSFQGPLR